MDNKNSQVIKSLSGEDSGLLEYIPYILQDLYSLGTDRELLIKIIEKNLPLFSNVNSVLDLCCGKGASILTLAQEFGWSGKGIDLFNPFVEDAIKRAAQLSLHHKITFDVMDIAEAIIKYKNYDLVLYGSDVDTLGNEEEALLKISKCLSAEGYLIYETAYLAGIDMDNRLNEAGINIIDKIIRAPDSVKQNNKINTLAIEKRITELIKMYPEKSDLFKKYLQNQIYECVDLEENYIFAIYLLSCKPI